MQTLFAAVQSLNENAVKSEQHLICEATDFVLSIAFSLAG